MDEINKESEQYGGGQGDSDFFKFGKEKKVYKIRILNKPAILATHFFGPGNPSATCVGVDEGCKFHGESDKKPSIKLVTYVIDREDNKVKLAELPLSISYSINDLQDDDDFRFEEFPMPYDVKITHDPNNDDPKAKYRLVASPNMIEVTNVEKAELDALEAKMSPEQYVEKRKEKQKEKSDSSQPSSTRNISTTDKYPTEEISSDDIPF